MTKAQEIQARAKRMFALVRLLGRRIKHRQTSAHSDIMYVSGAIENLREAEARSYRAIWTPGSLEWMCNPRPFSFPGDAERHAESLGLVLEEFFISNPANVRVATGMSLEEIWERYNRAWYTSGKRPTYKNEGEVKLRVVNNVATYVATGC